MRVNEALPGCDERVVTIYSNSEERNRIEDDNEDFVCPAFDALFKVHDMVVVEEFDDDDDYNDNDEYSEGQTVVTVRMLVPSDQIGYLIGKGGPIIQTLRNDTNAQIRVRNDNLPMCTEKARTILMVQRNLLGMKTMVKWYDCHKKIYDSGNQIYS
uniref:Putative RNA-binding protein n=1 Tax=Arabidopsis thaliana TaxID=3702 RepID=O81063_ARATH|nr:putative RNA-binding protein [Arabidopsis thaliana]